MKRVLVALCILSLTVIACGGGGGSDDGGNSDVDSASPSTSAETSLTPDNAVATSQAISTAAVGVSQAISGTSPSSKSLSQKSLGILKDTGSFSGIAAGSGGGNCTLTGSGASELDTNPMTFSVSGTMVCSSYVTTVATSSGDVQVTLNGSISTSMSGSIKKDYSSVEISFTMNWSDLIAKIGNNSFSSVTGSYSLSIVGNNGVLVLAESGTVGNQSVSQTRTFTVDYTPEFETISVFDNYDDRNFLYVDTSNYLGTYTSLNPASNTCLVNPTAYITAMTHSNINFDIRGANEAASGDLAIYYDMYFYTSYATTYFCTFGVSSSNISSKTIDTFVMICYDYSDVRLCDAGWVKDSPYDATYSLIKSLSTSSDDEEALDKALENLEEYNKVKWQD